MGLARGNAVIYALGAVMAGVIGVLWTTFGALIAAGAGALGLLAWLLSALAAGLGGYP